jgi:glycosyltransferase involved in cell wall biosynthesis
MDGRMESGNHRRIPMITLFPAFARRNRPLRLNPRTGAGRGLVVLSYLVEPFSGATNRGARGHTNWQECVAMAEAWRTEGFAVEVVDRRDRDYRPPPDTSVVIDLGVNVGRWAEELPRDCVKILHATGAHWRTQNEAELRRLRNLWERRGFELQPRRQNIESRGIESADLATVLGNDFTMESFRFAGKKLHRIPISSAYEFSWLTDRDFDAARRRFLWMGSYGMVHKGLDLVLEAFARMPDLELTVCGRPEKEEDFFAAYREELTALPNVRLAGWIDPSSPEFGELRRTHAAVVYPSCSEGGGGAVIHAMHAGLLPVVTREASVDIGDFGEAIAGDTVEAVAAAVRAVAALSEEAVELRCRAAWDHARKSHTLAEFNSNYHRFAAAVASGR